MLGAAGVQIPENNLDDLESSREEDGTLETMGPQDWLGFFLLANTDLRNLDMLTGTLVLDFLVVVVILVKGYAFPTIVKVQPVGLQMYPIF
ncbi:hypothetical protein Tco_0402629, partial [Tanacetum coccineum]